MWPSSSVDALLRPSASSTQRFSAGVKQLPNIICVGCITSSGSAIMEMLGWPANTMLSMGMPLQRRREKNNQSAASSSNRPSALTHSPNVKDLWVALNTAHSVSLGVKPKLLEMKKMAAISASSMPTMVTITTTMDVKLIWFSPQEKKRERVSGQERNPAQSHVLENVSQKVL